MKWLQSFFFFATLFLIPSNLFLIFFRQSGYVHGLFIDYLVPKLYLTDITMLLFVICSVATSKKVFSKIYAYAQTQKISIFLLLLFSVINLFFVTLPSASTSYLIHVVLICSFFWMAHLNGFWHKKRALLYTVMGVVLFQSLLGLYQYLTQHELFGYSFLGEPTLSALGITHAQLSGADLVLPYGTTAHPNVLAGVLALGSVLMLFLQKQIQKKSLPPNWLTIGILLLSSVVLLLTRSVSGILSAIVGSTLLYAPILSNIKALSVRKTIAILCLFVCITALLLQAASFITTNDTVIRRVRLQNAAGILALNQPLFGVGVNHFTAELENYAYSPEIVRFVQPVHMVPLLIIAETGLLGGILIIVLLRKLGKHSAFYPVVLALVPLLVLDHYLVTLQTGLLIGALFLSQTTQKKITA